MKGSHFFPNIKKKAWIIIGCVFSVGAQIMLGPSKLLGLDRTNTFMMGTGYATMGFFDTFMLVFTLPEMIETVEDKYPKMTEL